MTGSDSTAKSLAQLWTEAFRSGLQRAGSTFDGADVAAGTGPAVADELQVEAAADELQVEAGVEVEAEVEAAVEVELAAAGADDLVAPDTCDEAAEVVELEPEAGPSPLEPGAATAPELPAELLLAADDVHRLELELVEAPELGEPVEVPLQLEKLAELPPQLEPVLQTPELEELTELEELAGRQLSLAALELEPAVSLELELEPLDADAADVDRTPDLGAASDGSDQTW